MTQRANPPTHEAIRSTCESIRLEIGAFDREGALDSLLRAQQAIDTLRGQYRQDPELFKPHVGALRTLGVEVRTRLKGATQLLVQRFFQAKEAASAARAEEAALRGAIVELCKAEGSARVEIPADDLLLRAKRVTTFRMPKASSEAHGQLLRLLEDANVIGAVSSLSASKLGEALGKGSLPGQLGDAVRALCPAITTYWVRVSPSKPAARGSIPPSTTAGPPSSSDGGATRARALGLRDEPDIAEEQELVQKELDEWGEDVARSKEEGWFYSDEDEADVHPGDDEGS